MAGNNERAKNSGLRLVGPDEWERGAGEQEEEQEEEESFSKGVDQTFDVDDAARTGTGIPPQSLDEDFADAFAAEPPALLEGETPEEEE